MKAGKALTRTALKGHPLPAVVDGDKETKGRIFIIAGCRELAGAALLVANAAMRAGAGKLRMATLERRRYRHLAGHAGSDGARNGRGS